ncbi:lysine transporter LysE [Streptomyces sp. NBC_00178]|uniref:lysine transporter LysE n=1 Tax=Streptomyces sp. NBC_00178 TaxID=2975672 RepID=UPI002E2C9CBE|nr:lysine transporter LysE [Streptomyces sp. NBC_00178]
MKVREVVRGVGAFLRETVGEAVAEVVLGVLACAVLAALVPAVVRSWSLSPVSTIAGAGLLSLLLAHGGWNTFREPGRSRARRGVAAAGTVGFAVAAGLAGFLVFYGTGCDCF